MREEKIAKRYARALLATAKQEDFGQLEQDLTVFSALLEPGQGGLIELFKNPSFSIAERELVVRSICSAGQLTPAIQTFALLLVRKGRICVLPAICQAFIREVDQKLVRMRAQITTSAPLDEKDLQKIVLALEKRTQRKILPEVQVDSQVVMGVRANIGGLLFDGTLQTALARMQQELLSTVAS